MMIGNEGLSGSNADILMHHEEHAHSLLVSILSGMNAAREVGRILNVILGLVD